MNYIPKPLWILSLLMLSVAAPAKEIQFGGFVWAVRSGTGGPGPNVWAEENVWLDASKNLHLKISQKNAKWTCSEITLKKWLGFGEYQFKVVGPIDRFDDNVVLGLFNYPTADVGPDATHEIDIEFARWGNARNPIGNYTVWPVKASLKQTTKPFSFILTNDQTTHQFIWSNTQVGFRSMQGHGDDGTAPFAKWHFQPSDATQRIAQKPMPIHINLWLFKGLPPKNSREVEVIIHAFTYVPEEAPQPPDVIQEAPIKGTATTNAPESSSSTLFAPARESSK
jgi:hypothetical protein